MNVCEQGKDIHARCCKGANGRASASGVEERQKSEGGEEVTNTVNSLIPASNSLMISGRPLVPLVWQHSDGCAKR